MRTETLHLEGLCVLTKPAGDVIGGAFVFGHLEEVDAAAIFDEFAHQEESGEISHTRGLLHVVRGDDDGVILFQFAQHILNIRGDDGVKR